LPLNCTSTVFWRYFKVSTCTNNFTGWASHTPNATAPLRWSLHEAEACAVLNGKPETLL